MITVTTSKIVSMDWQRTGALLTWCALLSSQLLLLFCKKCHHFGSRDWTFDFFPHQRDTSSPSLDTPRPGEPPVPPTGVVGCILDLRITACVCAQLKQGWWRKNFIRSVRNAFRKRSYIWFHTDDFYNEYKEPMPDGASNDRAWPWNCSKTNLTLHRVGHDQFVQW